MATKTYKYYSKKKKRYVTYKRRMTSKKHIYHYTTHGTRTKSKRKYSKEYMKGYRAASRFYRYNSTY